MQICRNPFLTMQTPDRLTRPSPSTVTGEPTEFRD